MEIIFFFLPWFSTIAMRTRLALPTRSRCFKVGSPWLVPRSPEDATIYNASDGPVEARTGNLNYFVLKPLPVEVPHRVEEIVYKYQEQKVMFNENLIIEVSFFFFFFLFGNHFVFCLQSLGLEKRSYNRNFLF